MGICGLTKSSFRSDVEVIEAESRVKVSEMRAGAWCGTARVHLVLSNLARERRQEGRVCGGIGKFFKGRGSILFILMKELVKTRRQGPTVKWAGSVDNDQRPLPLPPH